MILNLFNAADNKSWVSTVILIVLLAVMVVVLVVLPMFTNRKRAKAVNDLHGSIRPGDVIKTVGGVIGKVIAVNELSPVDKEMVIETGVGDNKTTLVFDIQAVYQVVSKVDAPAPVFEEGKAEEAPAVQPAVVEEVAAPEAEAETAEVKVDSTDETVATAEAKPAVKKAGSSKKKA